MGYFPFYTGVKIPWNTGSGSGARTKLGQGGNNRKKEQEMKAVKPDMTGIKDDIHDDYRPIYDKLMDDYLKYYQQNIEILSDPTNPRYPQIYSNVQRMKTGIESFADWQQEEYDTWKGYNDGFALYEVNPSDPKAISRDNLEFITEYANQNDYLAYAESMGNEEALEYYFGKSMNDADEHVPNRPALIEGVELTSIDSQGSPDEFLEDGVTANPDYNPNYGQEIDNSINPSNWSTDEEGFFLDIEGNRMTSHFKNIMLEPGYEPYTDEESKTIYGGVEEIVKNFHNTASDWSILPNGQVVVRGYGTDEYRPFRDIKDYSWRGKDFLKAQVSEDPFAALANNIWDDGMGAQGKIDDNYMAKMFKTTEYHLGYGKNDKGETEIQGKYGLEIRQKLAHELAAKNKLTSMHVNQFVTDSTPVLDQFIDSDLAKKIRRQYALKEDMPIQFGQYATVVAMERMKKFLHKHKGMKEANKIYFSNTRWDIPVAEDGGYDWNKSLPVMQNGEVNNWAVGQTIRFEDNDEPSISARVRNNMPIYLTSQAGVDIEPNALEGLNLRFTRTGIVPVLINSETGQPIEQDDIEMFPDTPTEWSYMMDTRINIAELVEKAQSGDSEITPSMLDVIMKMAEGANKTGQKFISAYVPLLDGSAWTKDPFARRTDIISTEELEAFISTPAWKIGKNKSGK